VDAKTIGTKGLESACRIFLQDLEALPAECFDKCLGGKARTVADIVHEVNLVNDHVGLGLRGEKQFDWPEGWVTAPADCRSKEDVIASFKDSSAKAIATVESFTPEQFVAKILDEGKETTPFERVRFMTLHLWYHIGQLNFIQTLLGDDGWNWK
jgi:hypothetical protein